MGGGLARIREALEWRAVRARTRLAARRRGAGVVLCYHRVGEPARDPWNLAVSPRNFEDQLSRLATDWQVMSLADLGEAARAGRVPARAVAVTFDDGYVDNLKHALPALERYRIPATVFIASGPIGTSRPFWWDELEWLLCGPGERPARLELTLGGDRVSVSTASTADRRRALVEAVHPMLQRNAPAEIESLLGTVASWAGVALDGSRALTDRSGEIRPMTRPELERLAACELIEVGAHTVGHPSLPVLGEPQQRAEIEGSRDYLAELTGKPPESFAYPYGHNDERSRRIVRQAGFERAVGFQGLLPVTAAADQFEIPRSAPRDESGAELDGRLGELLGFRSSM